MFNNGKFIIDKTLQSLIEQIGDNNNTIFTETTVSNKQEFILENLQLLDNKLRQLQEADDDVDFTELPAVKNEKPSAKEKAALVSKLSKLTRQELLDLQKKNYELLDKRQKEQAYVNAAADCYEIIRNDSFVYESPIPLYNSELGDGFLCNYSHIEDSYTDINLVPNEHHIQQVINFNVNGFNLNLADVYNRIKKLQLKELIRNDLSNVEKLELRQLQNKIANYVSMLQHLLNSFLTIYGVNDKYTVVNEIRTSRKIYQLIFNHKRKIDSLTAELLAEKVSVFLINSFGLQIPKHWNSNDLIQFVLDLLSGKLAVVIYLSKAFVIIKLAQLFYTNKTVQNRYSKLAKQLAGKLLYKKQLPQTRAAYKQLQEFLKSIVAKIDSKKIKQPENEIVKYFLFDIAAFLGYPVIVIDTNSTKIYTNEKTLAYKLFNEMQVYGDHLLKQQKSNKAIRKFWFNILKLAEVGDPISWYMLLEENNLDTLEPLAEMFNASFKFDL